jgi:hypothetical protein
MSVAKATVHSLAARIAAAREGNPFEPNRPPLTAGRPGTRPRASATLSGLSRGHVTRSAAASGAAGTDTVRSAATRWSRAA